MKNNKQNQLIKKVIMLSTKDMSAASGKEKPVIGTGNHKVKSIQLVLIKLLMMQMHTTLCCM